MVVIAVLTLLATGVGAYFTWRSFRQARLEAPGLIAELVSRYEDANRLKTGGISEVTADGRLARVQSPEQTPLAAGEVTIERLFVLADPANEQGPQVPRWALALFTPEDAERYEVEWNYHLHILIQEGKPIEARRVRRHLAVRGIVLACEVRARRALRRRGAR